MPEIEVPCPTCSGAGESTHEDRHAGTDKDVYLTCGGRRTIPARPGESRETSWPWAVPGAEAPSSTPGEAERLVDAFGDAAIRLGRDQIHGDPDHEAASNSLFVAARAALLSHISTAGRGEGAAYEELEAVSARVQQGWDADESIFDAARLRWLDAQARKSRTGISFDWVPPVEGERSGFRFMRRFFVTEQCDTLKAAIDRAMLEDPEHPSDRKIDPEAESARLVAAITGEAPGPLLAEIAEGRAAHRRSLAARLQHRLDAMAERGMESVGISKGFAAELVHALSADATNPQDQE